MRTLLLLIPLALSACSKSDPIEACVEAEKKLEILKCDNLYRDEGRKCPPEDVKILMTIGEPSWRKKCMMAAVGKE
jgi:hypothetical protein